MSKPVTWAAAELERMRARVKELVAQGHPRSVASQVAFAELVTARALARGLAAAAETPEPAA